MSADFDVNVPATTRGLQAVLATLDAFCDEHGIAADLSRRARVVVEELFTNTIKYGYGGECERPVRLNGRIEDGLVLVFEDEAPPFDLTTWTPPALLPDQRPVGQAGIVMILGLCSTVTYSRVSQRNSVMLIIAAD